MIVSPWNRLRAFRRYILAGALLLATAPLARAEEVVDNDAPEPVTREEAVGIFEHLTVHDGLSSNRSVALLRDHRGFLWIGAQNGLTCSDGSECREFEVDREAPNALRDGFVRCLAEGPDGTIWIGTRMGLHGYDPAMERCTFVPVLPDQGGPSLAASVVAVEAGVDGSVWVEIGDDVYRRKPGGATFARVDLVAETGAPEGEVGGIHVDDRGRLWAIVWGEGVAMIDPVGGEPGYYAAAHDSTSGAFTDAYGTQLATTPDGKLWFASYYAMHLYDASIDSSRYFWFDTADTAGL